MIDGLPAAIFKYVTFSMFIIGAELRCIHILCVILSYYETICLIVGLTLSGIPHVNTVFFYINNFES